MVSLLLFICFAIIEGADTKNKNVNVCCSYRNLFNLILSKRNTSEIVWKENKVNILEQFVRLITDYRFLLGPPAETVN